MNKRLCWFDEGAPPLRSFLKRIGREGDLPTAEDYYACPCCLNAYTRDAVHARILTEEHVPPEALGGTGMLLTCKNCNNGAGTNFDAHAVTRAESDDFARGKVTGLALPATAHVDGIPLRGTARWTDNGIQIFGVPKQNDPRVQAAHLEALDAYADSGNPNPNMSFTVHTRFDEARARISWIRSAYLAAFSAFGWPYIFRPVMAPVREQLANPDARLLPTYMCRDFSAPADKRLIMIVEEPDELRCVAVALGERIIFLPGLFRTQTWDELAEAFRSRRDNDDRITVKVDGKFVPWPQRATYLLDGPQ